MATLVDQILIISKLDSKTMKIRPTEVSIRSMFSELANEFTPMAEHKGLTFEVRAEPLMIVTDGLLLNGCFVTLSETPYVIPSTAVSC